MLEIGLENSELNKPSDNNKNWLISIVIVKIHWDLAIKLKLNEVKQTPRADLINRLPKWFQPLHEL